MEKGEVAVRRSWVQQSCNNAVSAVRLGADGCRVLKAINDGCSLKARRGYNGDEPFNVPLKWLHSTAASCRQSGVSGEDLSRRVLAHLWAKTLLSEEQCFKLLGIDRLGFRKICDDLDYHQA